MNIANIVKIVSEKRNNPTINNLLEYYSFPPPWVKSQVEQSFEEEKEEDFDDLPF